MIFTPSETSKVYFLTNIPFDSTYNKVIDFVNIDEQTQFFNSKILFSLNDYNFIRKDSSIIINRPIDTLYQTNYLTYEYKGKRIYCFITEKRFKSINSCEVAIKTDVYQTYLFDHTLETCFVERCHVKRWENGQPTNEIVEENLEIGDYEIWGRDLLTTYNDSFIIVSSVPLGKVETSGGGGGINPPTDDNAQNRLNVVNSARKLIGKPYVWGGNYPPLGSSGGTDCSGLMQWAYNDCGKSISRTTYTQINEGVSVPNNALDLKLGDLIFSRFVDGKPEHVFMFSGNTGNTLYCVEAQQEGTNILERQFALTGDMVIRRIYT